ncbi:MAG: IS66 family transposase [Candidatus Paceibacterota bacterium]
MSNKRIIALLEDQLQLSDQREKSLLEQLAQQSTQLRQQSIQIKELTASIRSLEEALLLKNGDIQALTGKNRGLGKLLSNKSEKITVPTGSTQVKVPGETAAANLKERGNNNAKRKEFFDIETIIEEVYPNDPGFDKEKSRVIGYVDSILYECIPAKFIKRIFRQYNCLLDEKIYSAKAPRAPLLNSNYDGSFIAGMLQLRYIYSMPVERIVKYFAEHGFEINKSTAHGLIKKSAWMMERLNKVLNKTILEDDYLSMDESYYTILTKEKNSQGKGVRKGYIWAALGNTVKLVQYFYENGSRSREVLTNYIGEQYKGAIQSDGLANYKILETGTYPGVIRLSCFQHCKRKFLDIEEDEDAKEIVDLINSLYRKEHEIKKDWEPDKILKHRHKYAPPILEELKEKLLSIQSDPGMLPKSPLAMAVNYTLGEYDALCNYILRHDYKPDNNAIERLQRYISLSRKNSLFCGSHAGAERTALIYSLACSCRLNGINTFEYFTDILNRLAYISPNAPDEVYQELLPNRWTKK